MQQARITLNYDADLHARVVRAAAERQIATGVVTSVNDMLREAIEAAYPAPKDTPKKEKKARTRISKEDKAKAIEMIKAGDDPKKIAEATGMSLAAIYANRTRLQNGGGDE